MAEAYVNHLASIKGVSVRAESAGTVGGKNLNPMAIQAMAEDGVSMAGHQPKLLTEEMVRRASKVISMGCGVDAEACPTKFILTEDWGLDDPAGQSIDAVRIIRDQIRARVEVLLESL